MNYSRLPRLAFLAAGLFAGSLFSAETPPAPCPVPAEVAIARPSAAEIAKASDSLKRFLDQADAETKQILAKFPDLLAVRPPRINPTVVPYLAPPFRAKHAANVEVARKGDIDVLFMGDSITDWWRRPGAEGHRS